MIGSSGRTRTYNPSVNRSLHFTELFRIALYRSFSANYEAQSLIIDCGNYPQFRAFLNQSTHKSPHTKNHCSPTRTTPHRRRDGIPLSCHRSNPCSLLIEICSGGQFRISLLAAIERTFLWPASFRPQSQLQRLMIGLTGPITDPG